MKNTFKALITVVAVVCSVAIGVAQTRPKFEVVSIRPAGPAPQGTRGGGPGGGAGAPAGRGARAPVACPWRGTVLDPAHLTAPRITALSLVSWAYKKSCVPELGLLSGQPDWTTTDLYDFQATMPAGTPAYGFEQLQNGEAPKLQEMLQTMLEERFKLKFHREKKEVAAYDLVVAKPGKMTPSKDQTPPPDPFLAGAGGRGALNGTFVSSEGVVRPGMMLLDDSSYRGTSITVSGMAGGFAVRAGRPVIDKTGLTGFFDIKVPVVSDPTNPPGPGRGLTSFDAQVLDGLGWKLEPSKTTVEAIVIEHIEKPTPN